MPAKRKFKSLRWMPLVVAVAASMTAAAGVSLIPSVGAATDADVTVTGTVSAVLDVSASCSAANLSLGTTMAQGAGASYYSTPGDCAISFNTNNGNGASLSIKDNDANASTPAFCKIGDCAVAASQFNNAAAGGALADGAFGWSLRGVGGTTAPTNGAGIATNAATTQAGDWYPALEGAGTVACQRAGAPTAGSTCNFRFGADTKALQNSGNYSASIRFTTTAL